MSLVSIIPVGFGHITKLVYYKLYYTILVVFSILKYTLYTITFKNDKI